MKKIGQVFILGAICAFFLAVGIYGWKDSQQKEYKDCLEEMAFQVNGQEVKMEALAFYILYEEREIENQAMLYNPDNTRDYWNLHVDGIFIQSKARETIMQMAIHDHLFYEKAKKQGLTLTAEEEQYYRNAVSDFWMDLLDGQLEKMPVSEEYILETMRKRALAEKYQQQLAEKTKKSYASYHWDGYEYQQWLEKQDVKINHKLWDQMSVGNISLTHGKANYINGLTKKESE